MNSAVVWTFMDALIVLGVYCVDGVSVMEGDSVTLHTGVKADQHEKMKWFFNDTRIAEINGITRYICTDVQCNDGTERFRDRLELDHQTGSLTITNTRTTDSGLYHLENINSGHESEKTFSVTVYGVPAASLDATKRKSVKEGQSVTLELPEERKPNDLMIWYFNDTLIAEITGDQSEICTDDQCKERFRDRLKLDQIGSLTITNTRITDSGLYKLQINSSNSIKIILAVLSVNAVADSGLSPAAVAGIVVAMLIAVAAVIYYCKHRARRKVKMNGDTPHDQNTTPILTAYAANRNP